MLRILGSRRPLCEGLSRRDLLQAGALGAWGLTLADFARIQQAQAATEATAGGGFGRAKACILLYLYGAATQMETFDVKPAAPLEIRGELGTIETAIPGFRIGELLPLTARIVDRTTVVRSMSHPFPLHASAYSLTSTPVIDVPMQMSPRDPRHWPFIGSVVDYLESRGGSPATAIPRNIGLPWQLSSRRNYPAGDNAGPYGAFLGATYDPVWTEWEGEGTRESTYTFGPDTITCYDPYGPIRPDCRFSLAAEAGQSHDVALDRLDRRRSLLAQFDAARRTLDRNEQTAGYERFQDLALSYLTSNQLRDALDVRAEPASVRERYGMTLFGQASLVARRLIEAGSKFVTVLWDEFGLVNSAWDTHYYHYDLLRNQLCPGFDRAFSGLVLDLEERGLLDETLVACITEHGRTPKIESVQGGGRNHWSRAYASIFAGGGIARGRVVGSTDRTGAEVIDAPINPKDVLATIYHLLGIDPHTLMHDRLGRPVPVGGDSRVVGEMLG